MHGGISPNIMRRLYDTLARCGPFADEQGLRAVFIDTRISQWRETLPNASSPDERVKLTVGHLSNKQNSQGENALVLFLRVLSEGSAHTDVCHQDLAQLAVELEQMSQVMDALVSDSLSYSETLPQQLHVQAEGQATIQGVKINQTMVSAPVRGRIHIGDKVYTGAQAVWLVLLLVLVAVVGWGAYTIYSNSRKLFRVAVPGFVVEGALESKSVGREFAYNLVKTLEQTFAEIVGKGEISILGPTWAGMVEGADADERARSAAQIADKTHANLVVYGVVMPKGNGWEVTPEFYVAIKNVDFDFTGDDMLGQYGQYQLGSPFEISQDSELASRLTLKNEFSVRVQALARIAIGLDYYRTAIGLDYDEQSSRFGQSLKWFESALEIDKEGGEDWKQVLYILCGNAAQKRVNPNLARSNPQQAEEYLASAENYYRTAMDIDSEYARAYAGLADIYYHRALETFGQTDDPADIDIGMLNLAIENYQQAGIVKKQPPLADIPIKMAFGLGQAHLMRVYAGEEEYFDFAITQFETVIAEYDKSENSRIRELAAEAHARLGLIYDLCGHEAWAIEEYKAAVNLLANNRERQSLYQDRLDVLKNFAEGTETP